MLMFLSALNLSIDVWNEFEAGQRDLIILDKSGNLVYHNNITSVNSGFTRKFGNGR